ncbi:hypothetical protein HPB49_018806 [Dermacentor silvarum]|uniref:Uncharacterized protein n=1 Tax=Dermacentor silvarum TaxID=543639 RepID=A0ACB8DF67_DERSI|nr:hypothetical protein HPB49_018806 [Dermacentor silvarum]
MILASAPVPDFVTFAVTNAVATATSMSLVVLYIMPYEVTTTSRRLLYYTISPALLVIWAQVVVFLADTYELSWWASKVVVAFTAYLIVATFYMVKEPPPGLWPCMQNAIEAERVVLSAARVCSSYCRRKLLQCEQELEGKDVPAVQPRSRSLLLVFPWLAMSWAYSHFSTLRGMAVRDYLPVGGYLGFGVTFTFPGKRPWRARSRRQVLHRLRGCVRRSLRHRPQRSHGAANCALCVLAPRGQRTGSRSHDTQSSPSVSGAPYSPATLVAGCTASIRERTRRWPYRC